MKISTIELTGERRKKQLAREMLAGDYPARTFPTFTRDIDTMLSQVNLGMLDRKIKHGEDLSYDEAFVGMCYVLASTNARLRSGLLPIISEAYGKGAVLSPERLSALGTAFLVSMAMKESYKYLTAEEVAGMSAATMLDLVVEIDTKSVIETSGMGGDKGYWTNNRRLKTINASTLSGIVLASMGLPAIKHGSYANTSAIGSTEAIEQFGAKTTFNSKDELIRLWKESGFCFLDAHLVKTVHDQSHLLMMETVNHVVGPMTPPISNTTIINKVMGVNEKVHPRTIAEAYALLHQKKVQMVGGVIAVTGLGPGIVEPLAFASVRQHAIVDELSPYGSVVAATYQGDYLGTSLLRFEDFGVDLDPADVFLENTREVLTAANTSALCGTSAPLADYLAMNASLGMYAYKYLGLSNGFTDSGFNRAYLRQCFAECRAAITDGRAKATLDRYVERSNRVE